MKRLGRLKEKFKKKIENRTHNGKNPYFRKPQYIKCFTLSKKIWDSDNASNGNNNSRYVVVDEYAKKISTTAAKKSGGRPVGNGGNVVANDVVTVVVPLENVLKTGKKARPRFLQGLEDSSRTGSAASMYFRRFKEKFKKILNRTQNGKGSYFCTPYDLEYFTLSKKIWDGYNAATGNNNISHVMVDEYAKNFSTGTAKKSGGKHAANGSSFVANDVVMVAVSLEVKVGKVVHAIRDEMRLIEMYPNLARALKSDEHQLGLKLVWETVCVLSEFELKELDNSWKQRNIVELEAAIKRIELIKEKESLMRSNTDLSKELTNKIMNVLKFPKEVLSGSELKELDNSWKQRNIVELELVIKQIKLIKKEASLMRNNTDLSKELTNKILNVLKLPKEAKTELMRGMESTDEKAEEVEQNVQGDCEKNIE
ncbi:hypothetical protein Dimus_032284 [Dionaea muscipula]